MWENGGCDAAGFSIEPSESKAAQRPPFAPPLSHPKRTVRCHRALPSRVGGRGSTWLGLGAVLGLGGEGGFVFIGSIKRLMTRKCA